MVLATTELADLIGVKPAGAATVTVVGETVSVLVTTVVSVRVVVEVSVDVEYSVDVVVYVSVT